MDNLTHSLVGAMVGDTVHRYTPSAPDGLAEPTRRLLGMGLMVVGNNLPDADFIYSAVTGSKLDYLLQHRGHTHTVLGAIIISFIMMLAVRAWLQHRQIRCSRVDMQYLWGIALLSPLLHLGLDFTNSYGVHPFWPVTGTWLYADAVFIVEPLLWATATPLLFVNRSWVMRTVVGIILLTGIVLAFGMGLVPVPLAVALTLFILVLGTASRMVPERAALALGTGSWLLLTAGFFAAGNTAEARIGTILSRDFPGAVTLDAVLTPMPVNPFCREVFAVQTEPGRYVVRKATLALAPGWLPAERCPQRLDGDPTAPLAPIAVVATPEVLWQGEVVMPRSLIGDLAAEYCAMRALLRFARVPWAQAEGTGWIIGDMRYDREPELAMAEFEVGPGQDECPAFIPAWTPPREDLLQEEREE